MRQRKGRSSIGGATGLPVARWKTNQPQRSRGQKWPVKARTGATRIPTKSGEHGEDPPFDACEAEGICLHSLVVEGNRLENMLFSGRASGGFISRRRISSGYFSILNRHALNVGYPLHRPITSFRSI